MSEQQDEEQYLDYSVFMRKLEKAEQSHNVDSDGVVEQLTGAAMACHGAGGRHQAMANEYMLAKVHYLAEIRRRVGIRGTATRNDVGGGFKGWAKANGLRYEYAHRLAVIGESQNPAAAIEKERKRIRDNGYTYRALLKETKSAIGVRKTDTLSTIKREWYKLSPVQRSAFLDWAIDKAPMSDYAEREAA